MPRRQSFEEEALDRNSEPFEPRRNVLEFRSHRENVSTIEICAALKRNEFSSAIFDAVAERAAGQETDLVAFGAEHMYDRKQRIEMARRGRRSEKNFHHFGPLLPTRRASRVSSTDATPSGAISGRPRSRPNGQHGERVRLPMNFRDWTLRYVCNAAADREVRKLSLT
jgi:hypothetical protein